MESKARVRRARERSVDEFELEYVALAMSRLVLFLEVEDGIDVFHLTI